MTILILSLASMGLALPQGTFFWDFESPGPNNNYWPSGWTYSPTGLTIGQHGAGLYHSATRSLEFRGQNGQFYIISQPLYFVAGEQLTFSCWVKNAGNGTVDTRMEWATSPSGPWTIFHDPNNFNGNAPWTENVGVYTPATSGTYYIRYYMIVNGQGLGYVDDFTLTYNEGAVLNVNSTGYLQPNTQIYRNGTYTGFLTNHSFPATPANVANLAGTYTPGTPPTGYHWLNPSITVSTTDFTLANGYVHTITFVLEKDFTLIVKSTGDYQPGTMIYKDTVYTTFNTDHTFTATTAAALAGSYSPGTAPLGYYWETTPISVLATGFTATNDYTQTITFVLKKYYELRVTSSGTGQPGTTIFKNSVSTGQITDYIFYSKDPATLAGSYSPDTAPAGYHWVTTPIAVAAGDFTAANNYTVTVPFVLEKDFTLIVNSTGYNQPGTMIYKDTVYTTFNTDHTFTATTAAALAGSYAPGDAPAGYHWATTPIVVAAGDFTAANNNTVTITFVLVEDGLPVELSGFTVGLSVDNFINLMWVTQSETNVQGFYILRNSVDDLATALTISELIPATNTSTQQSYFYTDKEVFADGTYYYWLQNAEMDGTIYFHGPVSLDYTNSGSGTPPVPLVTELRSVFPNPFNPVCFIPFSLAAETDVNFTIYNSRGQLVHSMELGTQNPGNHRIEWNGRDYAGQSCSTGIYLVRMEAGSQSFLRKALLVK